MGSDRRSVRFPLPLALAISRRAKADHMDFSTTVRKLCEEQLNSEENQVNSRQAALYGKAAFLAVSELLAMAKREDLDSVRRSLLARAGRTRGALEYGSGSWAEPGAGQGHEGG